MYDSARNGDSILSNASGLGSNANPFPSWPINELAINEVIPMFAPMSRY